MEKNSAHSYCGNMNLFRRVFHRLIWRHTHFYGVKSANIVLCVYIYLKKERISRINKKVGDHSRGWLEGSFFNSYYTEVYGKGTNPFPGLLHFTLDVYLIILNIKQGAIKYLFLSLWYDLTWDWTPVSRAMGEHFNR